MGYRDDESEIRAVTSGTEALGEVTVQLDQDGTRSIGRGASTDVIEASAKAYVDALNKLESMVRAANPVLVAEAG